MSASSSPRNIDVLLACASVSTSSTRHEARARPVARLSEVKDFATPPFCAATAMRSAVMAAVSRCGLRASRQHADTPLRCHKRHCLTLMSDRSVTARRNVRLCCCFSWTARPPDVKGREYSDGVAAKTGSRGWQYRREVDLALRRFQAVKTRGAMILTWRPGDHSGCPRKLSSWLRRSSSRQRAWPPGVAHVGLILPSRT